MTSSHNPPSSDATTGTGTVLPDANATIISTSKSKSSDSDSASEALSSSSWGVIDYDFPSVIAAANNSYAGFPPTVEVEAEDEVVAEVDLEVEKDAIEIVDEQTSSCSDNNSTDTTKHNNDDNNNNTTNNNNNNTIMQPSSKEQGREINQPDSKSSENNPTTIDDTPKALVVAPFDDTNNDGTNDKDNSKDKDNDEDTSIPALPDVPVPFVVGLQTHTIIDELKNIFVGDNGNNNNDDQQQQLQQLQARQQHSVEYAQAEKLADFADWGAYLRRYEDLQKVIAKDDHQKARQHYLKHGFKEGRDCGPGTAEKIAATTADWGAYLRRYEDLQKVIDKNDYEKARQHYLEYGFKEGRDCGPGTAEKLAAAADWGEYLRRYEDLQKIFGEDQEKARQHFLEYGYREGRNPSPSSGFVTPVDKHSLMATADWAAYLRRNTDLQQVCGNDHQKAKQHFLEYGFQEKRYAGPDLRLPPPEARSIPAWSDFYTR